MSEQKGKKTVIVSLTSFPAAISYAVSAVRSLMHGNVLPDKVVLYVTMSQFGEEGLPEELLKLERENDIFEIRNYDRDIRSYRKLVPALQDFPEAVIVTVDDDVQYHPEMLHSLLVMHEKYPDDIIAQRVKRIEPVKPYKKWKKYRWYHFLSKRIHARYGNLQTGVGGVLYPPGSLKKDMIDEYLFARIAPTADDIWFWAAAVANGRRIIPVPFGYNKPRDLGKPRALSLKAINFKSSEDRNLAALTTILKEYPLIREKIENER